MIEVELRESMDDIIYQKIYATVRNLAQELLALKVGDRIPNIVDWQKILNVSRGTVQNAFTYLKKKEAIKIRSRGNHGSFLEEKNVNILRSYCMQKYFTGVMPLPYSKTYEGLATALYESMSTDEFKFALSYTRGSNNRIRLITNKAFDFAIVSQFAAEQAINDGLRIKVIKNFGCGSYIHGKHVLVTRKDLQNGIKEGMRIGIDEESYDQCYLTEEIIKDCLVKKVRVSGYTFLEALRKGEVDAVVWNYDEIEERGYKEFNFIYIENEFTEKLNSAVIVIDESNIVVETIINDFVNIDNILGIQNSVRIGDKMPIY